ncbi:MAG: glycosyltransferase family 2 protein [Synechococcales bacterium]|nr:glycosyltransferase family 2 protein [Synechococcales bacterium]
MPLKVAAVVPCHNRKEKTLQFLDMFSRQMSDQADLRCDVVLVDAQSTDGTPEVVRTRFPDICLLHTHADSYWTASTNRGIEYALEQGYDYILTINDDALVEPGYVQALVQTAQHYRVPVLASRIDYQGKPGLVWALGTEFSWGIRLLHLQYHNVPARELPPQVRSQAVVDVEAAPGNGVLIHRSVFERIGLYAEHWVPHYHADSEFVIRAHRAGVRTCVAPQIVVYDDSPLPNQQHRAVPSQPFWSEFQFCFFKKKSSWFLPARIYLVLRYCPWYLKPIVLLQTTVVAMLGWIAKRQIQEFSRSFRLMRGKMRALANLE